MPTKRRKKEQSERRPTSERRQQIADAALSILGEFGVGHLTMVELAKRVGITDGTIFRHFKDKQEIVHAAVKRVESLLFEQPLPSGKDPLENLGLFFVARVKLVRSRPDILRVALGDRLVDAAGEVARSLQERSKQQIREFLVAAQAEGLIASDVSPDVLIWTVVGALRACGTGEGSGESADPERVWQDLERILRRSALVPGQSQ